MIKAVIFDMDGVLIDSERHWVLEKDRLFRMWVPSWTMADTHTTTGMQLENIFLLLESRYGLHIDRTETYRAATHIAKEVYEKKSSLLPHARSCISKLRAKGLFVGLASASPSRWVEMFLKRWSFAGAFDAVQAGDGLPGKPAPDIYLAVARLLKIDPTLCVAVEDSLHGVRVAKAAGMHCIGFRNSFNEEQDLSEADVVVADLAEIPSLMSTF